MIISMKTWCFAFIIIFYVFPIMCLKINTGMQYACSALKLECSREERIWVRKASLVSLHLRPTTNSPSTETSTRYPTQISKPPECFMDYTSLPSRPYCDITEAVVLRCSHLLSCEVSLQAFSRFCTVASGWEDVGVVVDDFICLPKTTNKNQLYQTLDITSEYYRDTNITFQYVYLTTPNYPSLWWYPGQNPGQEPGNSNNFNAQSSTKNFGDLSICAIKFNTDKIQLMIIDFKIKGNKTEVKSSGKSGILKIDSKLDHCDMVFAPIDDSDDVNCIVYGHHSSYNFTKSPSRIYAYLLVIFKPTAFTKLNLLVNVYEDKKAGLECNTATVTRNKIVLASTSSAIKPSTTTPSKAENRDQTEAVIVGASVAAALVLLSSVALVACVAIYRKKSYEQSKPSNVVNNDSSNDTLPPGKVQRNSSFLQAFKPVSIHARVYDKIRNIRTQSPNEVSYYAGETSQNQRIDQSKDHPPNGKDHFQAKEAKGNKKDMNNKNCKKNISKNKIENGNQPEHEMVVLPKIVDISGSGIQTSKSQLPSDKSPPILPTSPNHIPRPTFQPTVFPAQSILPTREPTDVHPNNAVPLEQIKSKLQNLHKTPLNHKRNSQFNLPPQPTYTLPINSLIPAEDIYANASEI